MTKQLFLIGAAFALLNGFVSLASAQRTSEFQFQPTNSAITGAFIENRGQFDSAVRFFCHTRCIDIWLTDSGAVFDQHVDRNSDSSSRQELSTRLPRLLLDTPSGSRKGHAVRMGFKHCPMNAQAFGERPLTGVHNYLLGNVDSKWILGARSFGLVKLSNVQEHIDAYFYIDNGYPRFDLVVNPGGNADCLTLSFAGQSSISTPNRDTVCLGTSLNAFRLCDLHAFQAAGDFNQSVNCRFLVNREGFINFLLSNWDRSKPLVIDPLVFLDLPQICRHHPCYVALEVCVCASKASGVI
jgi:hypothetical protein